MGLKKPFKRSKVDYKTLRPSMTVPDQTMSIRTIVQKYSRNIPVNVVQKTPVYSEQSQYDLEKLGRMEFGEKAALAADLQANATRVRDEHNDEATKRRAEAEEKARNKKASLKAKQEKHSSTLDTTMLRDTSHK